MTNCLDCPEEANYAAIALQLQETALQAEQCLYAVETSLRQVTNPATIVISMVGAQGVAANTLSRIGQSSANVLFANSPRVNMVAISTPWEPGVWEVGACITAIATGAVTVNTLRQLFIVVHHIGAPISQDPFTTSVTATEPNNGTGVDMTLTTTVVLEEGDEVQFWFLHGNTGSSVNVSAGALFWATRLSDAQALRVV